MTKFKIALAAALVTSTASVAMADSSKRHSANAAATKATPVRVDQNRNMSMMPGTDNLMMNVMDRASSPFACGG